MTNANKMLTVSVLDADAISPPDRVATLVVQTAVRNSPSVSAAEMVETALARCPGPPLEMEADASFCTDYEVQTGTIHTLSPGSAISLD